MGLFGKLDSAIDRVKRYWTHDIWTPDARAAQHFTDRAPLLVARTVYIVVAGVRRDRIKLRAAGLTYVSLLAMVPALVVGFSLFSAFGGIEATEAKLKTFIIDALAVESQRQTILGYLDQVLEGGGAAKLGTVGTALLILTVVSLLSNIELSFNDIWGLSKPRTMLQRFQVYWPLVTLAPILLGVSISLTTAFESNYVARMVYESVPGIQWLTRAVSGLLTCLFFTLLYQIMPNTRVKFKHAAVGGVVAGLLWLTAQQLYAVYASNALTYSALYGSLGAVPLFIIWIYVSWIVTLLGAMLTFAVQSAKTYEPEREVAFRDKEFAAVRLMVAAAQVFKRGGGAITAVKLVDQVTVPPREARRLLSALVRHDFLAETVTSDDEAGFVPGRPLADITLADILRALRADKDAHPLEVPPDDVTAVAVATHLHRAEEEGERSLIATTLEDLCHGPEAVGGTVTKLR